MDMGDAETRARVWEALAGQPGVGAWFTVWLLSRLSGTAASGRIRSPKAAASTPGGPSQACAGH